MSRITICKEVIKLGGNITIICTLRIDIFTFHDLHTSRNVLIIASKRYLFDVMVDPVT